jgi:hypothetical protein
MLGDILIVLDRRFFLLGARSLFVRRTWRCRFWFFNKGSSDEGGKEFGRATYVLPVYDTLIVVQPTRS